MIQLNKPTLELIRSPFYFERKKIEAAFIKLLTTEMPSLEDVKFKEQIKKNVNKRLDERH